MFFHCTACNTCRTNTFDRCTTNTRWSTKWREHFRWRTRQTPFHSFGKIKPTIYFWSRNRGVTECFKKHRKSLRKPRLYLFDEFNRFDSFSDFIDWESFSIEQKSKKFIGNFVWVLPSLKLVDEISANPCSRRIFFTNATFDDSIILVQRYSVNCIAMERCLK